MNAKNNGGYAFPLQAEYYDGELYPAKPGMSLRDWFAGQALSGIIDKDHPPSVTIKGLAKESYEYADAMLEERESYDSLLSVYAPHLFDVLSKLVAEIEGPDADIVGSSNDVKRASQLLSEIRGES